MSTSKLSGTKSLRPKPFVRETFASSLTKTDKERFAENALPTLRTGVANLILEHCHLDKFERSRYVRDSQILDMEQQDRIDEEQRRRSFRDNHIEHMHTLKAVQTKKIEDMTERWKETQLVKKNRQVRDLHFELATQRIENLHALHQRQVHTKQERSGIEEFERNMKRMGISGNEGAEQRMSVSYEATDAYEQRLRELNAEKFPTNEDVSNFKMQLRERTIAKRQARYEKARRRRRALIDQTSNENS